MAAAVFSHPQVPGAVARFASLLFDIYQGNRLLNVLLCDRGRVLIGYILIYLDLIPKSGTGERGATLRGVQVACRTLNVCSPGRAASVLAAMRACGYIVGRTDPSDRRRRILAPAPKLIAAHRQRVDAQFEAMIPVFPTAAHVRGMLDEPDFFAAFVRELGELFLAGFRVIDHVPVLARVVESNAALLLLSRIVIAGRHEAEAVGACVPISISSLSRHFSVSRAHIRNVLAMSEQAGLLERGPGDTVRADPALVQAVVQLYAVMFILFDQCATRALDHAAGQARMADALN